MDEKPSTTEADYTQRLCTQESVWWKRLLDVQMPYRWNVRRLKLGFTLDIGCGLGRNLLHLRGNGVGIDHNCGSVQIARSRGLTAFLPEAFVDTEFNRENRFDSFLIAHVVEHLTETQSEMLLKEHLRLLKPGGQVVIITPQEKGFALDPTHVRFVDFVGLREIAARAGLVAVCEYSFPFPRVFGGIFRHNEFVSVSTKRR